MKIGTLNISAMKVGSTNVDAAYLGATLVYSGGTPPTPTLQWLTFNNGDSVSMGTQVYGVKGTAKDISSSINLTNVQFVQSRTNVQADIIDGGGFCYSNIFGQYDNVELVFSDIGCNDYYISNGFTINGGSIQLLIYS